MKTFVLFVVMTLVSGLAMAAAGGGKVQNKVLYDEYGNNIATLISVPPGCTAVPTHAGDTQSVIILCDEED
jgi:hypothetical protein